MKTNLLKSIFISLILLVGATNAWAVDHTGGYIYFLKPSTWTESKVMMFIGHDTYTSVYEMTKVSNTDNLYRYQMPSWGGATYVAFANAGSVWGGGGWGPSNRTNAPHYTNVYNNYGFNSGSYYVIVPSGTGKNASITINYTGTTASSVNRTTKAISSNAAAGTVSVSGYYLSSATAVSTRSAVSSTASNTTASTTLAPASTATFKATANTGYEFVGWYDAASGGNQLSTSTTDTVKYDISFSEKTVYGRFRAKTYTVTLNASGGTGGTGSVTATYNAAMPSATMPTRNGYTFKGYYDAQSGGTQYYKADGSSARTWNKTAATTLYAQWELATYTITYKNLNGATHTNPPTYTINSATITFTAPTSKPVGYTFANWTPASIEKGSYGDKTVTANWTAATSTVELNQEEATEKGTASVTATYGSAMPAITIPSRTGYTFAGYYTEKNGGGTQYYKADGTSATTWNLEGAQTLYAKWEIINYNITYTNLNGAIHSNPPTYTIEDKEITFTAPTARTGYTFAGWTPASIAQGSTEKRTVIANWTVNQYTLTWELNGGTVTKEGTAAGLVDYGTILTPPILAKTGYTQNGWSPAVPNSMPASDATYTAQWTINQYTLTYGVYQGANGTIQLDEETAVTSGSATFDYNTELTLTAQPIDGYKVAGWYGDEACTQQIAEALESITITLTENKTVYVKIVDATEKTYDVTVRAGEGGTVSSDESIKVGEQTSTTITATPAAGYRFVNWEVTDGIVAPQDLTNPTISITANGSGSLTANFVRIYTVKYYATPIAAGSVTAKVDENTFTSGDALDVNTIITFTATPNTQCNFIKWVDGTGTELSTYATYEHTTYEHKVTDDITVKGIFTINQYTLTFSAGEGGHVSATANNSAIASPATLDYNTSVTLTAEPDAGCAFVKWVNEDGTQISTNPTYTFNLTAAKTAKAVFAQGTTVYMKAIEYWKKDHPRYAIYYWGAGDKNGWVDMTNVDCNGDIYEGYVPAGYTNFQFVRLAPSTSNAFGEQVWNQTPNLTTTNNAEKMYIQPHVYLKPNSNWKQSNARFAAYFYEDGKEAKWNSMNDLDGDGVYSCEIPTGYTNVIFCRMNPAHTDNRWNTGEDTEETKRFWNQTNDLTVPADNNSNNLYTVKDGTWDKGGGSWSAGPHKNGWQTHEEPSYKITYSNPDNGTITVTKAGNNVASGTSLNMGDEIKITFTPADSYELINYNVDYATETGEEGVYTVCGPTKITAEFAKAGTARTVYLRPNEDWLRDEPIFAAYAWNSKNNTQNHWYIMTTKADDYTGAYSCNISSTYDWVIFVRIKPAGRDGSDGSLKFENAWNQTKDLAIIDKDNDKTNDNKLRCAISNQISEGNDKDKYDVKWEENTPIWGLTANFNDWTAEKAVFKGYPGHLDVMPPFGTSHEFKLYNFVYENNKYLGNAGTMKRANSGQWWTMDASEQADCKMMLDVKGDYIYQMRFLTVGSELRKQISVTYPEYGDVYTLLYEYTVDSQTKTRLSYEIPAVEGEQLDTISFHVLKNSNPKIKLLKNATQQGDAVNITVKADSVYNFVLQQSGGTATLLDAANPDVYTGKYYIRTDAAAGGWGAYKQAYNQMTYSSYADINHEFDHYFCKWVANPEDANGNYTSYTNVKFCVANDYSHAISDEMNGDEYIEKNDVPVGCIPQNANVRFMWNSQTNEVNRAYISGSGEIKDRYLVLSGDEKLTDLKDQYFKVEGLNPNESGFADMGNWIYQLDAKAGKGASIALTATYNGRVQTFFSTSAVAVASEGNNQTYPVRFIYDFKTNNLVAAWLLLETENDVQGGGDGLNANMLLLRKHHEQAQQIQLANTLSKVGTAYGVMTFDKYFLNNRYSEGANQGKDLPANEQKSIYERALYWISFPFDVRIRDVFGFGEYMDTWIMEYYDGEARAKNGAWVDSESYWTYITDLDYVLKKGVGYVLCLDLDKMDYKSSVWENTAEVSLYFPSAQPIGTIDVNQAVSITLKPYTCSIERDNRNIYDSNWNVIGVPRFINLDIQLTNTKSGATQDQVIYYYEYIPATNDYKVAVSTGQKIFETMKAYMVQYAGPINWWDMASWTPKQIAARRNADAGPEKVSLNLELAQDDLTADKTFIQLQEEGATADFDMNKDLTKIINAGANIYTLVGEGNIQTAGNVLPMGECEVPVGVKVDAAGEYTFRMPDGTEGMVVELIDYELETKTNLLLFDYTVTLPKGTNEGRFALHIQPSKSGVTTNIDQINGGSMHHEGVQKYLIDGQLYIVREGVVYDAQGHRL